ncbi:MAG: undecaprenyl/decaprenyl-phosphate alpha-N-acetylglucosaminyl 1-phosphate transferase [Bacteroidaceae bacterium]|nr:undecaprenyl/decaprenyl-phosphate alpha-N-acetylglucosaminyl 1-phosphate transferase [Bacteroidaceae bacterium]
MIYSSIIITFTLSLVLGFIIIPKILSYCQKHDLYDRLDSRKLHTKSIPRLGGLAFLPSMLLSFLCGIIVFHYTSDEIKVNLWAVGVVAGMVIVYITGLADDHSELSPKLKFLAQFIAAALLPMCGLYLNNLYGLFGVYELSPWIGIPLTIYLIMFVNNSINLIDGIDGLSSSLCIIALLGFMYMNLYHDIIVYPALISGIIGVLMAYMYFNIFGNAEKGTKIFMGDSGSLLLGYMLSFFALKHAINNTAVLPYRDYALLLPLTLLLIPTFDVVRVIIVRKMHGLSMTQPDKRHIHHKIMAIGLTQHQTLGVIIAAQICFMALNYSLYVMELNCNIILVTDILVYMLGNWILNILKKEE